MNKLLLTSAILLTLSVVTFGQSKSNDAILSQVKSLKSEKILILDFDGGSNVTKVMAFGEDFGRDQVKKNNLSALSFGMTFSYVGRELQTVPASFITTFWAEGKNSGFAAAHNLTIVVDGESLDVGDARYVKKQNDNREFLNFNFPREFLTTIVNGRSVEMKMGNASFSFTPEHFKLFAGLLAISNPE